MTGRVGRRARAMIARINTGDPTTRHLFIVNLMD